MATKLNYKNILFVTGGTGGHIFPALSTHSFIKGLSSKIFFATDYRGSKNTELSKLKPYLVNIIGFEGKNIFFKIYSLFLLFIALFKAIAFIRRKNIKIVLGFGSYVQVPFVLAALFLNCDIILHEANAVMGRANKLYWRFVNFRLSAYQLGENYSKNTIDLGMPVRKEILKLYKKKYSIPANTNNFYLLIIGGSLGSTVLSHKICKSITRLPLKTKKKLHIIHQVRANELAIVRQTYEQSNIKYNVFSFINDISIYLSKATLVISRAGSSTIAENAIAGVPAIYFPLPKSIGNHQYLNALEFKNKKAVWIFEEKLITNGKFTELLQKIIYDRTTLIKKSTNSKRLSKPDAGKKLSKLILGLASANV